MSEVMTCMPFEQLMNWVLEEKKTKGTVFCVSCVCGPAAGPIGVSKFLSKIFSFLSASAT